MTSSNQAAHGPLAAGVTLAPDIRRRLWSRPARCCWCQCPADLTVGVESRQGRRLARPLAQPQRVVASHEVGRLKAVFQALSARPPLSGKSLSARRRLKLVRSLLVAEAPPLRPAPSPETVVAALDRAVPAPVPVGRTLGGGCTVPPTVSAEP
jgi:hypothetical protein